MEHLLRQEGHDGSAQSRQRLHHRVQHGLRGASARGVGSVRLVITPRPQRYVETVLHDVEVGGGQVVHGEVEKRAVATRDPPPSRQRVREAEPLVALLDGGGDERELVQTPLVGERETRVVHAVARGVEVE